MSLGDQEEDVAFESSSDRFCFVWLDCLISLLEFVLVEILTYSHFTID